jgi:hypothetical protein
MSTAACISDQSNQTFRPYPPDDVMLGDVVDPYAVNPSRPRGSGHHHTIRPRSLGLSNGQTLSNQGSSRKPFQGHVARTPPQSHCLPTHGP